MLNKIIQLGALFAIGLMMASGAKAGTFVPFKASISASLAINGNQITLVGIGTDSIASHMGKIGYTASGFFTGPNTDSLTETIIAANGDTITLLCNQVFTDLGGGLFHGTDVGTITGGTGRFVNATGTLTGETNINLNSGIVTKSYSGDISY